MTNKQQPQPHIQQASELLETGKCDLPVDWHNLAHRVAAHPYFSKALESSYHGNHRLINLIIENAAIALCVEFGNEL